MHPKEVEVEALKKSRTKEVESLKNTKPKDYVDHYKCWPIPVFVVATSVLQIVGFFHYSMDPLDDNMKNLSNSTLIYRPDKRLQIWRYVFYAYLHAGWIHLAFNILVQVLVGVPLEMVHGSFRVGCIYFAGILFGSLGTSVFDAEVYLVGASGGVYALLAAHIANVIINYKMMQMPIFRLLAVAFIATTDMCFALYDYLTGVMVGLPVSYIAHITGAISGITIGLVILRNIVNEPFDKMYRLLALGLYMVCIISSIIFNIFNPYPYDGILFYLYNVGVGQTSM